MITKNINLNINKELLIEEAKKTINFVIKELKPRGKIFTPFNIISVPVILVGVVLLVIRFIYGLGAVTNLSQETAWGFWIGFDVITGVAFAGGAYVITFVVYIMRVKKYYPIANVTILNGLLAYVFYAGALLIDIGRPWNIINPIIGNDFGYNSIMFLVAWHFMLYMMSLFVEFSPTIAEWLGWKRIEKFLRSLTLGAVIFGITLSVLHQAGVGAVSLLSKSKLHPLWYTEFIPILFVLSSIPAGLSMIIFEGTISHRVFKDLIDTKGHKAYEDIIIGLAKGASITLFVYYFFKAIIFIHEKQWAIIGDFWGAWYLIEVMGFVLVPCVMFANGANNRNLVVIRTASVLTMIGIILNRLNTTIIAFNWNAPVRYIPSWMEIEITLMVIFAEIWVFRWIVTRMKVLNHEHH